MALYILCGMYSVLLLDTEDGIEKDTVSCLLLERKAPFFLTFYWNNIVQKFS